MFLLLEVREKGGKLYLLEETEEEMGSEALRRPRRGDGDDERLS